MIESRLLPCIPEIRSQDKSHFLGPTKGLKETIQTIPSLIMIFKFKFPQRFPSSSELAWFFFSKLSSPPAEPEAWRGIRVSEWGRQRVGETSLWFWYVKNHHCRHPCCPYLPRPKKKIPEYEIWGLLWPKEAVFLALKKKGDLMVTLLRWTSSFQKAAASGSASVGESGSAECPRSHCMQCFWWIDDIKELKEYSLNLKVIRDQKRRF